MSAKVSGMCPRIPRLVNSSADPVSCNEHALDVPAGSREICHSTSDKVNNAFTVRVRIVEEKTLNLLKGISLVLVRDFSSRSVPLVVLRFYRKNVYV